MGGASSVAAEPQRAEPRGWALTLSDIAPSAKAYSLEEIEQLACAGRQVLRFEHLSCAGRQVLSHCRLCAPCIEVHPPERVGT
jgi:hypothetical protein